MSNEQWSKWSEWNGGECPVDNNSEIQIKCRDGFINTGEGSQFAWGHSGHEADIIAYRYRLDSGIETPEEREELDRIQERVKSEKGEYSAYYKDVRHIDYVDVYRVVSLFDCEKHGHAISHAAKKLLLTGARTGGKDVETEVREAIDSLHRWLEMREEDSRAL